MSNQSLLTWRNIFLIVNPVAGRSDVQAIRRGMDDLCLANGWHCEVYETKEDEDLAGVVRAACEQGVELVIAAGGDGTVWGACNGLIGSQVPLAILPVGTGNGLARALNIPLQFEKAIDLLAGDYEILEIDALRVVEKYFVLNVSAGISARTMQETTPEIKQQAGVLAYITTVLRDFTDRQMSTFHLNLDGHELRVRAVEVLVSNAVIGKNPPFFLYGQREGYQDGNLEVNILTAEKTGEFIGLAWELLLNPEESKTNLHEFSVKHSIRLDVEGPAMTVQGDGEVIGETPVEIHLVPKAVRVVVPVLDAEV
jgi:diacylglycerol kinase (ATP)